MLILGHVGNSLGSVMTGIMLVDIEHQLDLLFEVGPGF